MAPGWIGAEATEVDGLLTRDSRKQSDEVARLGSGHLAAIAGGEGREVDTIAAVGRDEFAARREQRQPDIAQAELRPAIAPDAARGMARHADAKAAQRRALAVAIKSDGGSAMPCWLHGFEAFTSVVSGRQRGTMRQYRQSQRVATACGARDDLAAGRDRECGEVPGGFERSREENVAHEVGVVAQMRLETPNAAI